MQPQSAGRRPGERAARADLVVFREQGNRRVAGKVQDVAAGGEDLVGEPAEAEVEQACQRFGAGRPLRGEAIGQRGEAAQIREEQRGIEPSPESGGEQGGHKPAKIRGGLQRRV